MDKELIQKFSDRIPSAMHWIKGAVEVIIEGWEEFKEKELTSKEVEVKDFEVIERFNFGNFPFDGDLAPIKSVKYIPTGEVFTVGDKTTEGMIEGFHSIYFVRLSEHPVPYPISILKHAPKEERKPLFKTFDNIDVFEGDSYWSSDSDFGLTKTNHAKFQPHSEEIHFSTEQAARDYILQNKAVLSLKDIENCTDTIPLGNYQQKMFNNNKLSDLVKQRIKL